MNLTILYVTLLLLVLFLWGIIGFIISMNEWRKTGFCKHKYELDRTNSVGQYHWYKCTKCSDERLM